MFKKSLLSVTLPYTNFIRKQFIYKMTTTNNTNTTTTTTTINSSNNDTNWEYLKLSNNTLDLKKTLFSGQSFIWKEIEELQEYRGVINEFLVILKYKENSNQDIIGYKIINSNNEINKFPTTQQGRIDLLEDYFNLKLDINQLFKEWRKDSVVEDDDDSSLTKLHSLNKQFRNASEKFKGLRLIRQNPEDCLFSFICSQNNNISRISKMVSSLILKYGEKIIDYKGDSYYKFPSLDELSKVTELDLNNLGFGYRSKFIVKSCNQVIEKGGVKWLNDLRLKPYQEAHKELTSLLGVGPKVADCVSLFSLDKFEIVPIDTHIFEISKKHMPSLNKKTLTPKIYQEIREFWEGVFGSYAGWAHTILFANEISMFKEKPNKKQKVEKKTKDVKVEVKEEVKEEQEEEEPEETLKRKINKRK